MVLQTFGLFLQQLLPICLNLARGVHAIKAFLADRFRHLALVMALGVRLAIALEVFKRLGKGLELLQLLLLVDVEVLHVAQRDEQKHVNDFVLDDLGSDRAIWRHTQLREVFVFKLSPQCLLKDPFAAFILSQDRVDLFDRHRADVIDAIFSERKELQDDLLPIIKTHWVLDSVLADQAQRLSDAQ